MAPHKRIFPDLRHLSVILAALLLSCCAGAPAGPASMPAMPPAYDYPLTDPFAATIIGTPEAMKSQGAKTISPAERHLVVFPARVIPEGFWYDRAGLQYGEMLQDHPASLVYIIGGTGAAYNARTTMALANALYRAGHHVVLLPSPTFSNFIVTASTNFFPGNAESDARDLYRVIGLIQASLQKKAVITATDLTGYSLGGWHAAFVAHLDAQQKQIGFHKVLLLNPPLDLYNSIRRLDAMLYAGLPNGINGLDQFINRALARLSSVSGGTDALDFTNENLLYEAYLKLKPPDERLQTTIGLAFRLAAANMIVTADIMSHAGYIYPRDRPFLSTVPMDDYLAVALRTGFTDYLHDIYRTHYLAGDKGMGEPQLIARSSLLSLRGWIAADPDIGLITNRDDIILASGEVETLSALFGNRAFIFPTGGHLGNIQHPAYTWQVVKFFGDGE